MKGAQSITKGVKGTLNKWLFILQKEKQKLQKKKKKIISDGGNKLQECQMSSNNPSLPQFVETCVEYLEEEGKSYVSFTDFCGASEATRHLSPGQTYVATALRPLRDWQFTPIAVVATRSPIGPGEVAAKSATDRGPRCDQISRSQVFVLAQKPGCNWFGRRQVPAKSPTSPWSVAD